MPDVNQEQEMDQGTVENEMSQAEHHRMMMEDFKRRFIVSMIFTVPILALSPLIQDFFGFSFSFSGDRYLLFVISAFIYFYGGKPFLTGFFDELGDKKPGMMTLISLAISVAFIYSAAVTFGLSGKTFFWELVTLIDIMLIGHYIEMKSLLGASQALEELVKLMPTEAHLITNEVNKDVKVDELDEGDKVLVKPGEKIPVDGTIIEGEASIDESMVTGESEPVFKEEDDEVIGGAVNSEGSFKVEVEKTGDDSYLSQVLKLAREAQESKSKTQNLADRAALWLTFIAITAGLITLGVWIYYGSSFAFSLERMVTVMVITCPHALGLAIPLVVSRSTSISAQEGVLIRERDAFEKIREVDTLVFDKTGTLTEGEFAVNDIITLSDMDEDEVLNYAASLESHSEHPIGQGIMRKADERNLDLYDVKDFDSITGRGGKAKIEGRNVKIASPEYLKEMDLWQEDEEVNDALDKGKTVVFLVIDDELRGAIALADKIRPESEAAVEKLHDMGIEVYMLTGDNEKVARWVSDELNLDGYYAEVLPDEKSEKVKELQEGYTVAMVGDGINDAPSLIQSDIGIAIGAGTDVAIESADIILVKNSPEDVLMAMNLSNKTYSKMIQNLGWATGYNAFAIPLAAGILFGYDIILSPAVGALLMSLSTVIVAINARLLRIGSGGCNRVGKILKTNFV